MAAMTKAKTTAAGIVGIGGNLFSILRNLVTNLPLSSLQSLLQIHFKHHYLYLIFGLR